MKKKTPIKTFLITLAMFSGLTHFSFTANFNQAKSTLVLSRHSLSGSQFDACSFPCLDCQLPSYSIKFVDSVNAVYYFHYPYQMVTFSNNDRDGFYTDTLTYKLNNDSVIFSGHIDENYLSTKKIELVKPTGVGYGDWSARLAKKDIPHLNLVEKTDIDTMIISYCIEEILRTHCENPELLVYCNKELIKSSTEFTKNKYYQRIKIKKNFFTSVTDEVKLLLIFKCKINGNKIAANYSKVIKWGGQHYAAVNIQFRERLMKMSWKYGLLKNDTLQLGGNEQSLNSCFYKRTN